MNDVFKIFLRHNTVLCLMCTLAVLIYLDVHFHLIQMHYLVWLIPPIVLTPFVEFCLHKYILHVPLPKNDGWLKEFMLKLHHLHHQEPKNIEMQFAPPLFIVLLHGTFYLIYALVTMSFIVALIPTTMNIAIYLFYEWMHLAHHTATYQPKTQWGKNLKKAHMMHHYMNENYWWGVTSNIADKLLGTYKERDEVERSPYVKNISRL